MKNNIFVRKIAYSIMFLVSMVRDYFLLKNEKCKAAVLCYHRIDDIYHDDMTISTSAFEHQIRLLKKYYHVVSASELAGWIEHGCKPRRKKTILITFDDGYEDNFKNALPILRKYSCPAIFFVPTSFVSSDRSFRWDEIKYPGQPFAKITWEQLKESSKNNIEIGIHGDAHIDYGKADLQTIINDIEISVHAYKCHFGNNPIFMAYPYGGKENITKEVKDYIRNHKDIELLFAAYGGCNTPPVDRYSIKRIFISNNDQGIIFRYRIK